MGDCLHCGDNSRPILVDPPIHAACVAPYINAAIAGAHRFEVWRDELQAQLSVAHGLVDAVIHSKRVRDDPPAGYNYGQEDVEIAIDALAAYREKNNDHTKGRKSTPDSRESTGNHGRRRGDNAGPGRED